MAQAFGLGGLERHPTMAYDGMAEFVSALEARGELVRVRGAVSPKLEVAAIADKVMKAGGPALLFERVEGSAFPLLINAYGSRRTHVDGAGGRRPRRARRAPSRLSSTPARP